MALAMEEREITKTQSLTQVSKIDIDLVRYEVPALKYLPEEYQERFVSVRQTPKWNSEVAKSVTRLFDKNYLKLRLNNIVDLMKTKHPSLQSMKIYLGEDRAHEMLFDELKRINLYFDIDMNPHTLNLLTMEIINDFKGLSLHDIRLVISKAAKKEKIFGRIDLNIVYGWLNDYISLKGDARQNIHEDEKYRSTAHFEDRSFDTLKERFKSPVKEIKE